jgi:transcriptional regulator with XRE-family HTH domain
VRATLAANIKACLEHLEWSESELARRSGVSQKQVNNIVRERNGCSVEALHELGRALGVPYWLLLIPNLGQAGRELDEQAEDRQSDADFEAQEQVSACPPGLARLEPVTHLRVRLQRSMDVAPTPEDDYPAEVIRDGDRFHYRARGVAVPVTEEEVFQVVSNPFLYYFSTALKLHKRIDEAKQILSTGTGTD